ncbi:MAG: 30S ribosomal protein S10 [Candidatus Nezhaarchaeales archaeon]
MRIRMSSPNLQDLNRVCDEIKDIAMKMGVKIRGPVQLPTKKLVVPVRKAPSGQGSHTFNHFGMRIHKRIIDLEADERVTRALTRIRMPETIRIEVEVA